MKKFVCTSVYSSLSGASVTLQIVLHFKVDLDLELCFSDSSGQTGKTFCCRDIKLSSYSFLLRTHAFGHHPHHISSDSPGPSHWWWSFGSENPCFSFRLSLIKLHGWRTHKCTHPWKVGNFRRCVHLCNVLSNKTEPVLSIYVPTLTYSHEPHVATRTRSRVQGAEINYLSFTQKG